VATSNVARRPVAETLAGILESQEVAQLVDELEATRSTGRPGYPLRAMIGMALAKSLYALPCWTRVVALVREHPTLAAVIAPDSEIPSHWACYRFAAKLREHSDLLESCVARVLKEMKRRNPLLGWDVAIDASDMPAYANGQRFVSKGGRERSDDEFSDPDATWGHRSAISTRKGGGFYGYRLHMAVCAKTDLPLAWRVETASMNETPAVAPLLDKLKGFGFNPETCTMDKGYDNGPVYEACEDREIHPVICLKETARVKRGEDKPPTCEHGSWRFAGADQKRRATKWRCPTGECGTKSKWLKTDRLHPLIPRETLRWKSLYRGRASVERAFGRLKNEWSLAPLRVRRIERVRLHANLTILTKLACALIG
jgi:transposase, IS5 family